MRAVADRYTDPNEKRLYKDAARRFRLPYWDPYLPRNHVERSNPVDEKIWGLPRILAADKVYVKRPGETKYNPIDNPLYSFKMPDENLTKDKHRVGINWKREGLENIVSLITFLYIHLTILLTRLQRSNHTQSERQILKAKLILTILMINLA